MNLRTKASAQVTQGRARLKQYKSGAPCDLTTDEWLEKLIASNGICPYCGQFVGIENLSLDHIIRLADGGTHSISNVQPACLTCNQKRNAGIKKQRRPREKSQYEINKEHIDKLCLDTLKR